MDFKDTHLCDICQYEWGKCKTKYYRTGTGDGNIIEYEKFQKKIQRKNKRIALEVYSSSLNADGIRVYLDDYENREQAEEAIMQGVLEHIDYGIKEVQVDG